MHACMQCNKAGFPEYAIRFESFHELNVRFLRGAADGEGERIAVQPP